jgi:dipeptidyl aminopeptidase/acylaminoacyl peptidase
MKFVNLPVLIIRGSEDEIVGTGKDKEVLKLIKAEYKLVEKGDHNFTNKDSERKLIEKTLDWFKKYLK